MIEENGWAGAIGSKSETVTSRRGSSRRLVCSLACWFALTSLATAAEPPKAPPNEPDFTAMSLRRGSTMTVGFLVRDIANPLFSDMVKAAGEYLDIYGYSLLLTNSDGDPDRDVNRMAGLSRESS